MDQADHMSATVDLAVAAIRGADPARFDDPTPCAGWTVRTAVSHLAFGLLLAERAGLKQEWDEGWSGSGDAPYLVDVPVTDWAARAAEQGAATARAWARPDAWEGEASFGGSPMPAQAIGSMMVAEFAVHAWDVATSTGQTLDVPAAAGEAVLAGVGSIAAMGRDGGWYGAEVPVPADAPAFTRALGLAGRDPAWRP
jgi:uncharacterized protein (TIGR03086 family)